MVATDGNDSLATISDTHYVDPVQQSRLGLVESSTRIQKPKGGPHAPWNRILPASLSEREQDTVDEPLIFSDKKISSEPVVLIVTTHEGPVIKDCALNQLQRKPGHVPVSDVFHTQSYRMRFDDSDDEDLDRIANIKRKKVDATLQRGKSVVYDSIFWDKGEFSFPYRTFRPKIQVASHVPPGATPQGIIADRLHRIYRRLDLHTLLTKLGVEYSDLLPPPNYGEQNPRFLQESMWRNRSRISGVEKRTYIYGQSEEDDEKPPDDASEDSKSESSYSGSESSKESGDVAINEAKKNAYLLTKSQFGHNFPLEYFDNEDFDIRSAEDWMSLRVDGRGREKYPLPGKAFMPIPLDHSEDLTLSLSQITSEVLLDKTARLQAFRKWLIKQRYRRIVHDAKERHTQVADDLQSDAGFSSMIQLGGQLGETTVKSLIDTTEDSEISTKVDEKLKGKLSESGPQSSSSIKVYTWEYAGESELDSLSLLSLEQLSEDFLSQFSKGNPDISAQALDLVKRSQSILSDLWSDPNSLELLLETQEEMEETLGEVAVDYSSARREIELAKFNESMRIIAIKTAEDIEHKSMAEGGLASPDIDAFCLGNPDFVYDYNKMKKVHTYNWKWMEVAVFEYDTVQNRYLVRTISKPVIFAWVPKIYLCFDAEDPNVHAERIKDAIDRRNIFESSLRYNLYVDCLPIEGVLEIPKNWIKSIERKLLATPRFTQHHKALELAKKEVSLDYMRAQNNMFFDRVTDSHPKSYKAWVYTEDYYRINYEPGLDYHRFQARIAECATTIFAFKKYCLEQNSVIYKAGPFGAFSEIITSTVEARTKILILPRLDTPMPLELYISHQMEQIKQTQDFIRTEWLEFVVNTTKIHLEKVPHSWYNMDEKEWNIFQVSKISKYLQLVKFLMQDTLRFIVLDSLTAYLEEIRAVTEPSANLDEDYEWTNDLKTTEFPCPSGHAPIWTLELSFSHTGPTYLHYLRDFPRAVTDLVLYCVEATTGISDILPLVMKKLLLGIKKKLSSITKEEQEIVSCIDTLQHLLKKALLPVDIYAQKYKHFMPIWHLNLEQYMEEWNSVDRNAKEIRTTVDAHINEYAEVEGQMPTGIDIGPFRINIEPLRTELLLRKKLVYTSILETFANKLRNTVLGILKDYEEVEERMNKRSDDIEEVMELKHYLAGVPAIISRADELIQNIMRDYEVFERFKFRISLEDFEARWTAMMGLRKMYKLADEAVHWLAGDYRRLLRVQKQDLALLSEAVDYAMTSVAALGDFVDVSKVHEAKRQVHITDIIVKSLQEGSELFNRRQTLFGLPPVQKEMLARIVEDMHKYKSLWITIGDWLKIEEEMSNTPMDKLDVPEIDRLTTEGLKIMRKSIKYFSQIGEIRVQRLARKVKRQIDNFRKLVPLVHTFMNPGLRQRHLEAISQVCGFPLLFSSANTLKELLEQGVRDHVPEIEKIGEDAAHELVIEMEFDQMEEDASELRAILEKDPDTEIEIVLLPEGAKEFLELSTTKIAEFQQSPYKGPFVTFLDSFEKKLHSATETLKHVESSGPEWVQFQETFDVADVETKMPPEFKIFLKMKRIWRRIIRIIRVTSQILEFGSDKTLMASITQFQELNAAVRALLIERMKPKGSDSDDD